MNLAHWQCPNGTPLIIRLYHRTNYNHSCRSFIHSLIHSLTNSLTYSVFRSFIHSIIHAFIHPFIHSFIHSFINSFKQSINQSINQSCIRYLSSFVNLLIPIYRYKYEYSFIDLVESPGIAHIINKADDGRKQYSILGAVIGLWPIATVTMVTVYLAGVVAWALVSVNQQEYRLRLACYNFR